MDFGEFWGGFWESFGRVLGGPWRLLGHFFASFFKALLPRGLKRVQEAAKRSLGLDLRRFWRGFGKGLGGQNGKKIEIFGYFLDTPFDVLILVDFCSIFDNFDGGMVKNTFFSMGGCWCFWRGLGRKQDALR